MLNNKKITFVIALLVAIGLWVYVIGTKDPVTNKKLSDVPVTFDNITDLQDEGLAIASLDVETVNVVVSGNKSKLSDIEVQDVTAKIDAAQLIKGENSCKINVKVPEGYTCEEQSSVKATVNVDKAQSIEKDVKVVFSGNAESGKEPTVQNIVDKKVSVTGAESLIGAVAYVQGTIDAANVDTSLDEFNVKLKAVNDDGDEIKYMSLSTDKTKASAILYNTKSVELEVPVVKGNTPGVEQTVEAPKTVIIKGEDKAIEKISKLKANTLDVSKITQNTSVDISINLPEGVMIADSNGNLQAKVSVVNNEKTKTLTFSSKDIKIKGDDSARIADFSGKITITGDDIAVDKVTVQNLGLYIDLADAEEGTTTVKIAYTKPDGINTITINPEAVSVTI